jgi:hypothetical protein
MAGLVLLDLALQLAVLGLPAHLAQSSLYQQAQAQAHHLKQDMRQEQLQDTSCCHSPPRQS